MKVVHERVVAGYKTMNWATEATEAKGVEVAKWKERRDEVDGADGYEHKGNVSRRRKPRQERHPKSDSDN